MHDINLITTIAFGLTAALIFGLLAKRCGLSPIARRSTEKAGFRRGLVWGRGDLC